MTRSILRTLKLALVLAPFVLAGPAAAITAGQVDDFQTDRGDWGPDSAVRQANGGPEGDGDSFFKYQSLGSGAGSSRAAVRTDITGTDWAGDYNAAGVTAISVDVLNNGEVDLDLRLSIGSGSGSRPRTNGTWYTTAIAVPIGTFSGWNSVTFNLTDADMVAVQGTDTLAEVLAGVTQIRILSSDVASNRGDRVAAFIGIDNVTAIPEPSTAVLLGLGLTGLTLRRKLA